MAETLSSVCGRPPQASMPASVPASAKVTGIFGTLLVFFAVELPEVTVGRRAAVNVPLRQLSGMVGPLLGRHSKSMLTASRYLFGDHDNWVTRPRSRAL